ncbi:hypothetical protein HDC90_004339 [Pedobacter sp. AK013]|uniref:hypothetical protein n=1 Tax=Pedobacter sp. AK013 TaxID=2723071 RepID=UPI0016118EF6|nr:hypothetical protein [Pedobacter sp. AK013]MBB6239681.1 hypothetical protein [Pedobacter sp. AK013]
MKKFMQGCLTCRFIADFAITYDETVAKPPLMSDYPFLLSDLDARMKLQLIEPAQL